MAWEVCVCVCVTSYSYSEWKRRNCMGHGEEVQVPQMYVLEISQRERKLLPFTLEDNMEMSCCCSLAK